MLVPPYEILAADDRSFKLPVSGAKISYARGLILCQRTTVASDCRGGRNVLRSPRRRPADDPQIDQIDWVILGPMAVRALVFGAERLDDIFHDSLPKWSSIDGNRQLVGLSRIA